MDAGPGFKVNTNHRRPTEADKSVSCVRLALPLLDGVVPLAAAARSPAPL
jgi:hypothetical protein